MDNQTVLLRMEGICKSFPGVKALDEAQLTLRAGTVHALMGENGAGKSTLMKCLFGIYSKDAVAAVLNDPNNSYSKNELKAAALNLKNLFSYTDAQ